MAKLAKQSLLVNRLVRKTQNGTLGEQTSEPEDHEDVEVIGGDKRETHHHHSKGGGGLSLGQIAGIAALTLGTGGIGAVGIPWLAGKLGGAASEAIDTDTTTRVELETADGVLETD